MKNLKRFRITSSNTSGKTKLRSIQTKAIFVDVDGTLHRRGALDIRLVEWCRERKAAGYDLILWSAQGELYARVFASHFKIDDIFKYIISKPGAIVDDRAWEWIRFVEIIRRV